MRHLFFFTACVISLGAASGCSGTTTVGSDAGGGGMDVGGGGMDVGTPGTDGGAPGSDGGTPGSDSGTPGTDAGGGADGGCLATLGALGQDCTTNGDCPSGFVCQPVNGFILTQSCQIRCDSPAFTCPCGTACMDHGDKVTSWRQCDQL